MRVTRVFTDQPLATHTRVALGRDAARHLVTVLRLGPGDPVILFNGEGGDYPAEILEATSKEVSVHTGERAEGAPESPLITRLGIGLSRGDRFDWVLQKTTELGVTEITPLYTERTEVKLKGDREAKKMRHWQQVIISACEQCGRTRLPELHRPQSLTDWLTTDTDLKLLLHHRSDTHTARLQQATPGSVAFLVGPEGGLSDEEIELAADRDFQALALGPRVFRTETAPVAALSVFQAWWGDFRA